MIESTSVCSALSARNPVNGYEFTEKASSVDSAEEVDPRRPATWGQRLTLDTPRATQEQPQSSDGVSSVER